jgi:hypothetical protein
MKIAIAHNNNNNNNNWAKCGFVMNNLEGLQELG